MCIAGRLRAARAQDWPHIVEAAWGLAGVYPDEERYAELPNRIYREAIRSTGQQNLRYNTLRLAEQVARTCPGMIAAIRDMVQAPFRTTAEANQTAGSPEETVDQGRRAR